MASNVADGFRSLHDSNWAVGNEIENHQDRARQQGQPWYDIAWLWEALGINHCEA